MLSYVSCQNYRCLENVDVPLNALTALVGPNGSGKSAVLRAIDAICGMRWPSLASLAIPQDFTKFDTSRSLELSVGLGTPLLHEDARGTQHEIHALRMICKPYVRRSGRHVPGDLNFDFVPVGPDSRQIMVDTRPSGKPEFRPLLNVSTGERDEIKALFVDHRRTLLQHLPTVRGSVLSRLFEPVRREWQKCKDDQPVGPKAFADRYEMAMAALRIPELQQLEETIAETTKRMLGFLGSRALHDVQIGFGFADPANPYSSLRVEYREGAMTVPGDQLGLGTQSAIVIGIFEALRQLHGPIGTLMIEEPELALHPQARRYFHRILTDLADRDGCQVIYTTHSSTFADATRFESVRLLRRPTGGQTGISFVSSQSDQEYLKERRDSLSLGKDLDIGRSELLFAERVLLVEGPGDAMAARETAEKLGIDLDGEGLSVINCGGKTAVPFFARFCVALGIDAVVMHDEDLYEPGHSLAGKNHEQQTINDRIVDSMSGGGSRFILQPTLEGCLGIGGQASNKPRRVLEAVRAAQLEQLPAPLVEAVKALADVPPF
jgi:putative ATP-dependent endonuclease of OLD family